MKNYALGIKRTALLLLFCDSLILAYINKPLGFSDHEAFLSFGIEIIIALVSLVFFIRSVSKKEFLGAIVKPTSYFKAFIILLFIGSSFIIFALFAQSHNAWASTIFGYLSIFAILGFSVVYFFSPYLDNEIEPNKITA